MTKVHILLWDKNDSGGLALKDAMGLKRILKKGSAYVGSPDKVIINWGNSKLPGHCTGSKVINKPEAVALSVDKIKAFKQMELCLVNNVPYTTSRDVAFGWLAAGHKVVCRDIVNGSEGKGVRVIGPEALNLPVQSDPGFWASAVAYFTNAFVASNFAGLGHSPLYTRYVPFEREYRVHVVDGKAVNVRRKVTDVNQPTVVGDFKNVTIYPEGIVNEAVAATKALGLDFAGVDVLWDGTLAWVLETNTAPSIGGSLTVSGYASAIKKLIKERHGIDLTNQEG